MVGAAGGRPLRRDAARNRQLIVDVATEVLAEQGVYASMNDIANRAGVGVGTVYRRFPDRSDLIRAVFEQRLARLADLLSVAARDDDPWHGLMTFLEDLIARELADLGLCQLMDDAELREWVIGSGDTIRAGVEGLVVRAQASGQLRSDIGLADLGLIKRMISTAARLTAGIDPDQWRRTFALVVDSLRAPGATTLPGRPLSPDELTEVMRISQR